jgi:DNA invertase Pin-like site-specific DNA recombinase
MPVHTTPKPIGTTKRTASATASAVLYARVSSKDQEREGFSIPAQQKLLRDYARTRRVTILREFVDVETAKQTGRTGFGEMLRFLKSEPTCRMILVEKTDRLYRNIRDWVTIDDLGVEVHFVKEGQTVSKTSRSSDKFMHGIKVLMAKNYADNLGEEVKKGMREKAEQGHWPSMAPIGYVNDRATHRIQPDAVRAPLIAELFERYATGGFSLKALLHESHGIGLTHPRTGRRLFKSELHRLLHNPIYYGDFVWDGQQYTGCHKAIISRDLFDAAQAVFASRPRTRYPKQQHAFMGLLTCARCGCAITAERKKGKYVYYHCTGSHGGCDNTYIREERLGALLADVITPIHISEDVADTIANALRCSDVDAEQARVERVRHLDERRRAIVVKQDRAYDDFIEGRISQEFWTRKSEQWETEVQVIDGERARMDAPRAPLAVTAGKILELAKQAENLYRSQIPTEQRRLLETALSNCSFDAGTLCPTYTKPFDLLVKGNETGNWLLRLDSNQ